QSYARLPKTVPEIHQFGLLNEPFGNQGSDTAALRANWEFQVLLRLWEALKPRRVFHWGGFDTIGRMAFLNGSGFLRLVLARCVLQAQSRWRAMRTALAPCWRATGRIMSRSSRTICGGTARTGASRATGPDCASRWSPTSSSLSSSLGVGERPGFGLGRAFR